MTAIRLTTENSLRAEGLQGTFLARVWLPGKHPGPVPALVSPDGVFSLFPVAPTVSHFLEGDDPVGAARLAGGERIADVAPVFRKNNSSVAARRFPVVLGGEPVTPENAMSWSRHRG
jgi:fumarylacetoacetate (FAA) hydrolase family protein